MLSWLPFLLTLFGELHHLHVYISVVSFTKPAKYSPLISLTFFSHPLTRQIYCTVARFIHTILIG